MKQPSLLEQRIARAQEAISKWPQGKLGTMQLQGTDGYRVSGHMQGVTGKQVTTPHVGSFLSRGAARVK